MFCSALRNVLADCFDLSLATADELLMRGSEAEEYKLRPECSLSLEALWLMRRAKDASIEHMLSGGNGFPGIMMQDHLAQVKFELGVQQERRDTKALAFWQTSLDNCKLDMHRRFQV